MSASFGPLDPEGRVPQYQQTRAAAFLISAHGALARQFAIALPAKFESAWQTELNAQFYREAEIVALLMRATTWVPDFTLGYVAASWEMAWFPKPIEEIPDLSLAMAAGLATFAHAVHASIRPAALLPPEVSGSDPFAMALRRVEFESGHLLQAQILFLKSAELTPFRDMISSTLETRHAEIRELWVRALAGVGITIGQSD